MTRNDGLVKSGLPRAELPTGAARECSLTFATRGIIARLLQAHWNREKMLLYFLDGGSAEEKDERISPGRASHGPHYSDFSDPCGR